MSGRAIEVETKSKGPCWINCDHVVALWAGGEGSTVVALVGGHQVRVKKKTVTEVARLIGWTSE